MTDPDPDGDDAARLTMIAAELAADEAELVARRENLQDTIRGCAHGAAVLDVPTTRASLARLRWLADELTAQGDPVTAALIEGTHRLVLASHFYEFGTDRLVELGCLGWGPGPP